MSSQTTTALPGPGSSDAKTSAPPAVRRGLLLSVIVLLAIVSSAFVLLAELSSISVLIWPGVALEWLIVLAVWLGVRGSSPRVASEPATSAQQALAIENDTAFPYQIVEQLGQGSMGAVYKARHRMLPRPVALKTIKPGSVDAEDVARFKREARVTSELCSPHTVALYDFGIRPDGSLYYVMELLHGIDLQRFITTYGPMPPARAVHVLRQICHSLDEAHAAGLVHRDLKPANVMLCQYGRDGDFVKVVDFGLVKGALPTTAEIPLTKEHTVLGTPAYLAPESLQGSSKVDPRADIYAMGCMAFWLLTGRLVFEYDQALPMVRAHSSEAPPAPSRFVTAPMPQALDALVLQCLSKQPEQRPSAAALLRQLENLPAGPWTADDARSWWAAHPIQRPRPA